EDEIVRVLRFTGELGRPFPAKGSRRTDTTREQRAATHDEGIGCGRARGDGRGGPAGRGPDRHRGVASLLGLRGYHPVRDRRGRPTDRYEWGDDGTNGEMSGSSICRTILLTPDRGFATAG